MTPQERAIHVCPQKYRRHVAPESNVVFNPELCSSCAPIAETISEAVKEASWACTELDRAVREAELSRDREAVKNIMEAFHFPWGYSRT